MRLESVFSQHRRQLMRSFFPAAVASEVCVIGNLFNPKTMTNVQVDDAPRADGGHGSARLGERGHRQEDECRLPAGGTTEPQSMPQEIVEGCQRAERRRRRQEAAQSHTSSCQEAKPHKTEEVCQKVPILSARDPSPHSARRTEDAVSGVESESSVRRGTNLEWLRRSEETRVNHADISPWTARGMYMSLPSICLDADRRRPCT